MRKEGDKQRTPASTLGLRSGRAQRHNGEERRAGVDRFNNSTLDQQGKNGGKNVGAGRGRGCLLKKTRSEKLYISHRYVTSQERWGGGRKE